MPPSDSNQRDGSNPPLPPNSLSDDGTGELYVQVSETSILLRAFTSYGDPVELGEGWATNLGNLLLELAKRIRTDPGATDANDTSNPPTPLRVHPNQPFYQLRGGNISLSHDRGTVHLRASTPSGDTLELNAEETMQLAWLILELTKA